MPLIFLCVTRENYSLLQFKNKTSDANFRKRQGSLRISSRLRPAKDRGLSLACITAVHTAGKQAGRTARYVPPVLSARQCRAALYEKKEVSLRACNIPTAKCDTMSYQRVGGREHCEFTHVNARRAPRKLGHPWKAPLRRCVVARACKAASFFQL